MAAALLNDWLDVDVSFRFISWQWFHINFPVISFDSIHAVTEIEQQHNIFFGVKYCRKKWQENQQTPSKCFRAWSKLCAHSLSPLLLLFNTILCLKCLERLCLYLQWEIWFSGTSISEIIYCLRWSAPSWRLEMSCVWWVLCSVHLTCMDVNCFIFYT